MSTLSLRAKLPQKNFDTIKYFGKKHFASFRNSFTLSHDSFQTSIVALEKFLFMEKLVSFNLLTFHFLKLFLCL